MSDPATLPADPPTEAPEPLLETPDRATLHPSLAYLAQFVQDWIPEIKPSSRTLTTKACDAAFSAVQDQLNDFTTQIIELRKVRDAQKAELAAAHSRITELTEQLAKGIAGS